MESGCDLVKKVLRPNKISNRFETNRLNYGETSAIFSVMNYKFSDRLK